MQENSRTINEEKKKKGNEKQKMAAIVSNLEKRIVNARN